MEISQVASAQVAAAELVKAGYHVYLASFNGENAATVEYQKPMCLVIGSEGSGISPALYKLGKEITLPQRTSDISYNASVAAGILLFLAAQKVSKNG